MKRAETQAQCERFEGCFDTDWNMITAISEGDCPKPDDDPSSPDYGQSCDPDVFEWAQVHDWSPGVWSEASIIPFSWKQRALESVNRWGMTVSTTALQELIADVIYTMAGQAYIAEARCNMEPILAILEPVACACGEAADTVTCDTVWSELTCVTRNPTRNPRP